MDRVSARRPLYRDVKEVECRMIRRRVCTSDTARQHCVVIMIPCGLSLTLALGRMGMLHASGGKINGED